MSARIRANTYCLLSSISLLASWSCGARTDIDPDADGSVPTAGGAGGAESSVSSSSNTASSTASTGGAPDCVNFALDGLPVALPSLARSPQLTMEGSTMRVTYHQGRFVYSQRLEPETRWPEPFTEIEQNVHIGDTGRYWVAPASLTPVFLHTEDGVDLDLSGAGGSIDPVPAASPGEVPLFLVRNGDHFLYASTNGIVTGFGSYRTGDLPQSQDPAICLSSSPAAAAVASGKGFVAAFADASEPSTSCSTPIPQPGTSLVMMRYEPSMSQELDSSIATVITQPEPIVHIELAATPTGSWLVFQTDGAPVAPPIMAVRVAPDGQLAGNLAPVTPEGGVSSEFAAANLDEALVFAHVGLDDGVPVIHVQRVEPDGRLSATATIDISMMPTQGSLRLLGTPDQRSLIAAWEGPEGVSTMLKLDCAP